MAQSKVIVQYTTLKMKKTLLLVLYATVVTELHWIGNGTYGVAMARYMYELTLSTTPQHPPIHARPTHQSMPIMMTLSIELRELVQTVGSTCQGVGLQKTTSTVMVHNFD